VVTGYLNDDDRTVDSTTSLRSNTPVLRYPFFIIGGKKVVAQGVVLAAGMNIRHPSLCFSTNFSHNIKEFLVIWSTTFDSRGREMLSNKIRNLWVSNNVFHTWATNVYSRNCRRVEGMKIARLRITIILLSTKVDLLVSPLQSGKSVMIQALKKRRSVSSQSVGMKQQQKVDNMVLTFQGDVIDEKRTLLDAKVVDRSTLQMNYR
jgi:hypothetical protein